MAIVVLNITKFRAMFPEFSNVTDEQLPYLFEQATDYLNNSEFSLVDDVIKRERLLYLLMAHLAYMRFGDDKGNVIDVLADFAEQFIGKCEQAQANRVPMDKGQFCILTPLRFKRHSTSREIKKDKRPDGIEACRGVPFDISAAGGK